jgi:hypothetical protein
MSHRSGNGGPTSKNPQYAGYDKNGRLSEELELDNLIGEPKGRG